MTPRQIAKAAGLTQFEGGPCKFCGGTRRHTCNGLCAPCLTKKRNARQKAKGWPQKKRGDTRLRDQVFDHYGAVCIRCGIEDRDVLTVDHVNQDGAIDRKENGKSTIAFYGRIRAAGFPSCYRVLCMNCNTKAYRMFKRGEVLDVPN